MANFQVREITTPRLHLRKLQMEDLPHYYKRIASSETVTRYMLWKPHTALEESAASIRKVLSRYETGESFRWVIALKSSDELIGIIDLLPRDTDNRIWSFAYMLSEDFWNRGYCTEALKAVIDFAFQHWNAAQIRADHFADNPASGAVMKKAGMYYQYTEEKKYEKNGVLHDALHYCLTWEQWLDSKK